MKKVIIGILGIFLMFNLVLAANGNNNTENMATTAQQYAEEGIGNLTLEAQQIRNQLRENIEEQRELRNQVAGNIKERLQTGQELSISERGLILRKINNDIMELQSTGARVQTRLELNNDGNTSELRVRLSNGRNAEVKIMPEAASEVALARLRLKNCNETRNCTIELKEVGQGNQTRLVYEARAEKTFRILGLFRNREEVRTQIDAETGEEVQTRRPWWSWMAFEANEADEIE